MGDKVVVVVVAMVVVIKSMERAGSRGEKTQDIFRWCDLLLRPAAIFNSEILILILPQGVFRGHTHSKS